MNEEDILNVYRIDKDKGFRCLVKRYQQPLYWHIRRMVVGHDDTEDVLQETFLRVYKHWGSFKGTCKLSTWLYKIATNEALRFIEKNKKNCISLEEINKEDHQYASDKGTDIEKLEKMIALQKAVQSLPEKQRLVFNLRYYDELDYNDISIILDTQVETLKTNFFYAKENIKKYIQKYYYERI